MEALCSGVLQNRAIRSQSAKKRSNSLGSQQKKEKMQTRCLTLREMMMMMTSLEQRMTRRLCPPPSSRHSCMTRPRKNETLRLLSLALNGDHQRRPKIPSTMSPIFVTQALVNRRKLCLSQGVNMHVQNTCPTQEWLLKCSPCAKPVLRQTNCWRVSFLTVTLTTSGHCHLWTSPQ